MYSLRKSDSPAFNASSMADIAFLLLTFFMVTTVINEEKGLTLLLPPMIKDEVPEPVHERNLFTIQLNSFDHLMVEGEQTTDTEGLRGLIKSFVLNYGKREDLSEHPKKAIVSLKADRGASHQAFIEVLDEIQAAYFEIYAERTGISPEAYRSLDITNPGQRALYEKGREEIPMNISIAGSDGHVR